MKVKVKRCRCGDTLRIKKGSHGAYLIACDNCYDPAPLESWQVPAPLESWQVPDTRGSFTGGSEEDVVQDWSDYQEDQEG